MVQRVPGAELPSVPHKYDKVVCIWQALLLNAWTNFCASAESPAPSMSDDLGMSRSFMTELSKGAPRA